MDTSEVFQALGMALGIGFVVGLQRQRTDSTLAGVRTFPLITLFGTLCGLISGPLGVWTVAAGLLAMGGLTAVSFVRSSQKDIGLTTEFAMLVMFATGVLLAANQSAPALAIGGAVALLLHLKPQLHGFAAKLGDNDFKAIMQFVVVSLIVLPVLPDRYFGPYNALNPQRLWFTVVLIVGISLAGYLIYRFLGDRSGTLAGGILGGLISSTATTVSYARRSRNEENAAALAAIVIMIASTVVFARVLVLVGITSPSFLPIAAMPIGIMIAGTGAISLLLWRKRDQSSAAMPQHGNPSELKAALLFALLYGGVLLAVAFAKERFGNNGLYVVSILSGLTDMDAITLSVSQMVQEQRIDPTHGWRMIMIASLSNLAFKGMMVLSLGSRALFAKIALAFGATFALGLAILFI